MSQARVKAQLQSVIGGGRAVCEDEGEPLGRNKATIAVRPRIHARDSAVRERSRISSRSHTERVQEIQLRIAVVGLKLAHDARADVASFDHSVLPQLLLD